MKSIYYTLSVTWKELQVIIRDRTWLVILFLLPLLIGSFMGGANLKLNRPGEQDAALLKAILVNQDSGVFGSEVAKAIQSIEQFDLTVLEDTAQAEQQVAKGEAAATIFIPPDFSQKIDAYIPTEVKVVVDPAEPESASIVTGIMNQVVGEVTIWGEVQHGVRAIMEEAGLFSDATPQEQRAIEAQNLGVTMTQINQARSNPAIQVVSEDQQGVKIEGGIEMFLAYLFPGLTVMFIFFIVPMSSASLLEERETGTLRRLLAASLPRGAMITGKMLSFMLLACVQVVILLGIAHLFFSTPLGKSPMALVPLSIVVALTASAMGMMVAALAKTTAQAVNIGLVLAFVLAGLGGAMAMGPQPLSRSEGFIGIASKLTPHAHAVEGFYKIMAENASLTQILPQIGILLAIGIVFTVIAVWRFRYE